MSPHLRDIEFRRFGHAALVERPLGLPIIIGFSETALALAGADDVQREACVR